MHLIHHLLPWLRMVISVCIKRLPSYKTTRGIIPFIKFKKQLAILIIRGRQEENMKDRRILYKLT